MIIDGRDRSDIAVALKRNKVTIDAWCAQPAFKQELDRMMNEANMHFAKTGAGMVDADPVEGILERAAPVAARELVKLLKSTKESIRRDAATKILALTGHGERQSDTVNIIQISDEAVSRLMATAQSIGAALPVIEVPKELPEGLTEADVERAQEILDGDDGDSNAG